MHRSLAPILPLVALALMGNSCEFRAVSNNPAHAEEKEGHPTDGNGLVVVIRSVDAANRRDMV